MYPQPFKRPNYKCYYFRYSDPFTKKRILKSTDCESKKQAYAMIKNHIDRLEGVSKEATGTLAQFLVPWINGKTNPRFERYQLEGKQYGKRYMQDVSRLLTYVLAYPIASQQACQITRGMVLDFRSVLQNDPKFATKSRTVNRIITSLSSVYSEAVYRGDLKYNPFSGIGNIRYKQQPKDILTPDEMRSFLTREHFNSEIAFRVFSFAAYTGMRMSEVLALHWDQIVGRIVTVDRAWKTEHELGSPKWGKIRAYPLSELAIDCLPEQTDDMVFHTYGTRLGNTWWKKNFQAALDNAEIKKHITPHCLRHSLNSNLLLAGVSPFLIQHYLGWSHDSSITKVQEGYTHVEAEHLQVVADMIDSMYAPISKANNIVQFRRA